MATYKSETENKYKNFKEVSVKKYALFKSMPMSDSSKASYKLSSEFNIDNLVFDLTVASSITINTSLFEHKNLLIRSYF